MMSFTGKLSTITPPRLEALHTKQGAGLTNAQLAQSKEKIKDLYTAPKVFQPRSDSSPWVRDAHVRNLTRASEQNGAQGLERILIFAVGGVRIVLDGHCRLDAYRKQDPTGRREVGVRYFSGSFAEAMLASIACNSRDKLPLSWDDKAEAAWRFVLFEEGRTEAHSVREIEANTGCSKSVVSNMRQVLARHPAPHSCDKLTWNPRMMTWAHAKRGETPREDFDVEEFRTKQIAEFAKKLRKTFNRQPDKMPELFAEGLLLAYPRIHEAISSEIEGDLEEQYEHTVSQGQPSPSLSTL